MDDFRDYDDSSNETGSSGFVPKQPYATKCQRIDEQKFKKALTVPFQVKFKILKENAINVEA